MSDAAREAILSRVRQALKSPSPEPHWLHEEVATGPVFPLPQNTDSSRKERFLREFAAIQGELLEAVSLEESRAKIKEWLFREEIASVLIADVPLTRRVFEGIPQARFVDGSNASVQGWDTVDLGVTPCEALVAESGTIAVSAGLSGRGFRSYPRAHGGGDLGPVGFRPGDIVLPDSREIRLGPPLDLNLDQRAKSNRRYREDSRSRRPRPQASGLAFASPGRVTRTVRGSRSAHRAPQ
ncbi:MAG: hypothetical protein U1D30_00175 [Planctomycetota bacterium]